MKMKLIISVFAVLLLAAFSVTAVQELTISSLPSVSGNPGSSVTATITVSTGEDVIAPMDIAFSSSTLVNAATGAVIGAPSVTDLNDVAPNSTGTRTFSISLPALPAGIYDGTMTATDKNNPNNTETREYHVTINSVVDFTATPSVKVASMNDDTKSVDITITNTGSVTLNAFTLTYSGDTADNDDDLLVFTFTNPAAIAPGATGTAQMNVAINEDVDVDAYTGTVSVTANGVTKSVDSRVDVIPEICKSGISGDLDVTIDEPDSGETFNPGEEIDVQVNVENNDNSDMDVKVSAIFYNLDENDELRKVTSESIEVQDGEDEDFDLKLMIPTNLDEEDEYVLYVKAYEDGRESSNCDFVSSEINIERESHKVAITEVKFVPENVQCGEKVTAQVTVENIGAESEDDVYVQMIARDFNYNKDSETFDLDEFDDSDNEFTVQFPFDVPRNAKGEYFPEFIAHYNDGDTESKMVKMNVECGTVTDGTGADGSAILSVLNSNLKQVSGEKLVLELVLRNSGQTELPVKLDVTEAPWAEILGVEAPAVLNPGDVFHAYVYLKLKEDTQPGVHNMRVNLRKDSGLIESKLVSVVVDEKSTVTPGQVVDTTPSWKSWFTQKPKLFWIIADIVLVVLAILFIRLLFRK